MMGVKEKAILNEAAKIHTNKIVSSLVEYRYKKFAVGYTSCSDDQYIAKIPAKRNIRKEMISGYLRLLSK